MIQPITTEGLINKQELVKEIIRPTRRRKRFINSLLDGLFSSMIFYLILFLYAIGSNALSFVTGDDSHRMVNETEIMVMFYLGFYISYLAYFITFEYFFGKTIGKMVTNTKVVLLDGTKPKLMKIIMRSFARLIPLDFLSYLSKDPRGWHDTLSDTLVIDDISLYRIGTKAALKVNQEEI